MSIIISTFGQRNSPTGSLYDKAYFMGTSRQVVQSNQSFEKKFYCSKHSTFANENDCSLDAENHSGGGKHENGELSSENRSGPSESRNVFTSLHLQPQKCLGRELKRSNSVPNFTNCLSIPRSPIFVRKDPSNFDVVDGSLSSHEDLSGRQSISSSMDDQRDGLVDLTQCDPGGTAGHKRQVFVHPLPDFSTLTDKKDRSAGDLYEDEISPPYGWKRPRAFSCDVTLEVEVGKELRKIANDFSKTGTSSGGNVRGTIARLLRSWNISRVPDTIHEVPMNREVQINP